MAQKTDSKELKRLVDDLLAAHGENLTSVVLYGSAADGDHVKPGSDYNLLIALKRITPQDLRLSKDLMAKWKALGQAMPVYFTDSELNEAVDVFPIEFLQMERARKVLYGRDPFESLSVSDANLRHQTEYELRAKLIQLRRLFIPASASVRDLSALMVDSLASFAALFRAVLILLGHEPPVTKFDSVRALVTLTGLDGSPFERIFDLREKDGSSLTEAAVNEVFAGYMAQIERVIEVVNGLEK